MAEKFYRSQRSVIGKTDGAQIWVVGQEEIIAALVLHPIDEGHWLTSLLVAKDHREQGIAKKLIATARSNCGTKVWLFCHPNLCNFYIRQGFALCTDLPEQLAARLVRYQQTKPLCALVFQP
ncbi:GNAT family N-acetyltransferase [Ectopseudomonas mendocina]|uniref:GNAT family N-acetyltransferase n=1 Tax=Ectopseudomonas mendocina TaxID=300 RepID=A0ABZ2RKS7_ECTME